ncbi:hypothetical protein L2E82_17493 [Cichorium intybus]|uniref:Uncharacterized protein n=1 Tax=Cichorium intybus TaxID=13427 RepID=A0ACB9F7W3_CICIN|nr:hypothetical protein L2E82_17493 [Cichorium intybus]
MYFHLFFNLRSQYPNKLPKDPKMTASQTVRVEFGMWRRLFHNMKKKQLIALHHPKNIILLLSTKYPLQNSSTALSLGLCMSPS